MLERCIVCEGSESDVGNLTMSDIGPVCQRGSCRAKTRTLDANALVCACGHTARWHDHQGRGGCDHCDCAEFRLAYVDSFDALRGRVRELESLLTAAAIDVPAVEAFTPWDCVTSVDTDGVAHYDRNEVVKRFSANLRRLRSAAGMSRGQLARAAGLTAEAVGMWERKQRAPSFIAIVALSRALGIDPARFFE